MPSVSNHPTVNCSPNLHAATLFSQSEDGEPLLVPIIGTAFRIEGNQLLPAEPQLEINLAGECRGKPDESSYKYEPEMAFIKPATDVVLIGNAYAQKVGSTQVDVGLYVGPLEKVVRVIGDRYWVKTLGMAFMSPAEPFESIPLIYERAFGGWDRSNPDPEKHTFEPRNPVGTGFRGKRGKFEEGIRLPNLEDPRHPIMGYGETPPPAGFGFVSPNWQPRASFAGTYDEAWMKDRMPLLPKDFDRRFFNAASPGLIASGYLNGDELVLIENASPSGRISFNLPGVAPPRCRVELKGRKDETLETRLDTVIINTDENLVFLVWRAHILLRSGPHDVVSIEVQSESVPASAAAD
jgi:hypothetical protein